MQEAGTLLNKHTSCGKNFTITNLIKMKKKISLLTFILALMGLNGFSQTLSNTIWQVYDLSNTLYVYFHFGTDTLSFSLDNTSYSGVSIIDVNGSSLTIVDLPGAPCQTTDTGTYTFMIQNDTLNFTLVSDVCVARINTLTNFHWVRLPTGVRNINDLPEAKLYPNPFSTQAVLQMNKPVKDATLIIYNSSGQAIKQINNINTQTVVLSRDNLSAGLYFIQLRQGNHIIAKEKMAIID